MSYSLSEICEREEGANAQLCRDKDRCEERFECRQPHLDQLLGHLGNLGGLELIRILVDGCATSAPSTRRSIAQGNKGVPKLLKDASVP